MAGDAAFAALAEAVLAAPGVDIGIVGVVPLTAELVTLPPGADHAEDLAAPQGIAARLVELWQRTTLPWVVVVDAGSLYDPLVAALEAGGLPVFRAADRAVRALEAVVEARLRPSALSGVSPRARGADRPRSSRAS